MLASEGVRHPIACHCALGGLGGPEGVAREFLDEDVVLVELDLLKEEICDGVGVSVGEAGCIRDEGGGIGGFYGWGEPGREIDDEGGIAQDIADEVKVVLDGAAEFAGGVGGDAANFGGVGGLCLVGTVKGENAFWFRVVEEKSILSSTGYEFV